MSKDDSLPTISSTQPTHPPPMDVCTWQRFRSEALIDAPITSNTSCLIVIFLYNHLDAKSSVSR